MHTGLKMCSTTAVTSIITKDVNQYSKNWPSFLFVIFIFNFQKSILVSESVLCKVLLIY